MSIALSLNIENRRDYALASLVRSQMQAAPDVVPFDVAFNAFNRICDSEIRENLLCDTLEQISEGWSPESLSQSLGKLVPFINYATQMSDPVLRTRSCSMAISVLSQCRVAEYDGLLEKLRATLGKAWEAIDDDWIKVDVGFEISSILASHSRDVALSYLTKTDTFRKDLPLYDCRSSYWLVVRLAIRAYSGLAASDLDTEDDLKRLESRIDRIPSLRARAEAWTDIALRLFRDNHFTNAKKLVNEKLKPALTELEERNKAQWGRLLVLAAPAFYHSHKKLGLDLIATLPSDWIDLAYDEIIEFIFFKQPSSEPSDRIEKRFVLTYEEAVDICEILHLVSTDWIIYRHIEYMVESLIWKKNNYAFTQEQKSYVVRQLETIVDKKLPTQRFIKHDGFKIVATAQLARVKKGTAADWIGIRTAAQQVPNLADRAMVLAVVGRCNPIVSDQEALFLESKGLTQQIPSLLDRVDRLQILAGECSESDVALCKTTLREAMQLAASRDDPEFGTVQRRIIDLAHRISPELATSIVSSNDADPARARARARREAKEHLKVLALRGRLSDESESPDKLLQAEEQDSHTLGQAAWMTLWVL